MKLSGHFRQGGGVQMSGISTPPSENPFQQPVYYENKIEKINERGQSAHAWPAVSLDQKWSLSFAASGTLLAFLPILSLTFCMLGNISCFCQVVVCWFYSKLTFSKNSFRNTIRMSNGLDPDRDRRSVGPDLGPNCLQRLSPNDKSRHLHKTRFMLLRIWWN